MSINDFTERLNELVFYKGLVTEKLGKELGISGSTVRYWLRGEKDIRLSNALKVCDYFNCSLEFLVGKSEKIIDFTPYPAMPFYDMLRKIMKEKDVSRYRIVKDLKKSHKDFDQWKNGSSPLLQTVAELAEYLGVTTDYLVGRER